MRVSKKYDIFFATNYNSAFCWSPQDVHRTVEERSKESDNTCSETLEPLYTATRVCRVQVMFAEIPY